VNKQKTDKQTEIHFARGCKELAFLQPKKKKKNLTKIHSSNIISMIDLNTG